MDEKLGINKKSWDKMAHLSILEHSKSSKAFKFSSTSFKVLKATWVMK